MTDVLSFLNIKFVQEPYSDKDFIAKAQSVVEDNIDRPRELLLTKLSIMELLYFAKDNLELSIYKAHMQQLYNWAETGHTAYVDKVFEGLSAEGLPVLPAFQCILSLVSSQHLRREEPLGNPSLKVVSQEEHKKYALILVAQLMFYMGDGLEKATNKVDAHIRRIYGRVRGCSADNLERLYSDVYRSYVEDLDQRMTEETRLTILNDLKDMPDHSL